MIWKWMKVGAQTHRKYLHLRAAPRLLDDLTIVSLKYYFSFFNKLLLLQVVFHNAFVKNGFLQLKSKKYFKKIFIG